MFKMQAPYENLGAEVTLTAIDLEQTVAILTGPREVHPDITGRVERMLIEGTPIVNIDRCCEFVSALGAAIPSNPIQAIEANYQSILTFASCSFEMASLLGGDVRIPRPRRLYEHDQSVMNTSDRVFGTYLTSPRDRVVKLALGLQDGGKTHGVALALLANPDDPRPNRNQAEHNIRIARNVLDPLPSDVLSQDEKSVVQLLVQQTAIGTALRRHQEKGWPLDAAVVDAEGELNWLREQCPPSFRDRFDDYLVVTYLSDAGAHTQRACYVDAATGEIRPDVTHRDRFHPDGSETRNTLDRLFSEAPNALHGLKLHAKGHLDVMHRLFPNQAKYYE